MSDKPRYDNPAVTDSAVNQIAEAKYRAERVRSLGLGAGPENWPEWEDATEERREKWATTAARWLAVVDPVIRQAEREWIAQYVEQLRDRERRRAVEAMDRCQVQKADSNANVAAALDGLLSVLREP